jgi:hypothetical protein
MSFLPTRQRGAPLPPPTQGDLSADAEALFKEAKRRERRRRLGDLAVVIAICGAGLLVYDLGFRASTAKTSASSETAGSPSTATLAGCIEAWNQAQLGDGRASADAVGGNGRSALMFASSDGVCGLAFPTRVSVASSLIGVFVNEVGGDYLVYASPNLTGGSQGTTTRLEALADKHTNVLVELPSGKVMAKPHATMPRVPVTLRDTHDDCGDLVVRYEASEQDGPTDFKLVSTTVSCPLVRAVTWQWSAGESMQGTASQPPRQQVFAGWRCTGTDLHRFGGDWGTYMHVTCANNDNTIKVNAVLPRLLSQFYRRASRPTSP